MCVYVYVEDRWEVILDCSWQMQRYRVPHVRGNLYSPASTHTTVSVLVYANTHM